MKRNFQQVVLVLFTLCFFQWGFSQSLVKLFNEVNPAVVTIKTTQKKLTNNYQMSYQGGLGSGVVISAEGEILTASHVVDQAEEISVKFHNGQEIPAKVLRSAPVADLALIKLGYVPDYLKVAKLGNSDKTEIGEQIFIIGAPFGLEHSLSAGYISARKAEKTRTSGFTVNEFFQTDAAINTGNSGGPMFNLKGEVIGISSYIISKSGGFQGLGFAATVNLAKELVINGNRRWTGIKGYLLDDKTAYLLNVPTGSGILVESVVDLSPGDFAGLQGGFEKVIMEGVEVILGGDIILGINGETITEETFERLARNTGEVSEKKSFTLQVLRGGAIEELTLSFQ
jgi:serine protease Do